MIHINIYGAINDLRNDYSILKYVSSADQIGHINFRNAITGSRVADDTMRTLPLAGQTSQGLMQVWMADYGKLSIDDDEHVEDFLGDAQGLQRDQLEQALRTVEQQWREQNPLTVDDVPSTLKGAGDGTTAQPGSVPADLMQADGQPGEFAELEIPGYEILGELARGGMGVVYKARQLKLNRMVALKMILSGEFAGSEERDRFQKEAEAAAQLQHPHIVQIYEIGEHAGRPWFSLEFVAGGNLADKIAGTPQPAHEAARLVATIARAMHAAHQRGIIHRDLKPANVLLAGDGTPKIADFGLAKQLQTDQAQTQTGALLGTPNYTVCGWVCPVYQQAVAPHRVYSVEG